MLLIQAGGSVGTCFASVAEQVNLPSDRKRGKRRLWRRCEQRGLSSDCPRSCGWTERERSLGALGGCVCAQIAVPCSSRRSDRGSSSLRQASAADRDGLRERASETKEQQCSGRPAVSGDAASSVSHVEHASARGQAMSMMGETRETSAHDFTPISLPRRSRLALHTISP